VHVSLERITEALLRAGCSSIRDPAAVTALKNLGGYTRVINTCLREILDAEEINPRIARIREAVRQKIGSKTAEIREQVQVLLSMVQLQSLGAVDNFDEAQGVQRAALRTGSCSEVVLIANKIGWAGIADLINVTEDACEIADFKTGEPSPDHPFQLKVYSLLWALDAEVNPSLRLATKLTIYYTNGEVDVKAPTPEELPRIQQELVDRANAARRALNSHPPEARPRLENCKYCGVRQLCADYWTTETQERLANEEGNDEDFVDLEATITNRHGPLSWDAVVEVSGTLASGKHLVLRLAVEEPNMQVGDRIRLLGAHLTSTGEETQPAVVTAHLTSETFIVPR
jgi:CRISPR/Cas system-associated exonuclease Cas4 (RecB family)